MSRPILASILAMILASLACMEQVATPTPTVDVTASPAPSATLAPILASASPVPTATAGEVATVRAQWVNVRQSPNGEVEVQLENGTPVRVINCGTDPSAEDYNWCQIETDEISGYIFIGCLSIADGKGCAAK